MIGCDWLGGLDLLREKLGNIFPANESRIEEREAREGLGRG